MRPSLAPILAVVALCVAAAAPRPVQDPKKRKLQQGLKDTELTGSWIYDDIGAGFFHAKKTAKPLLIVFR